MKHTNRVVKGPGLRGAGTTMFALSCTSIGFGGCGEVGDLELFPRSKDALVQNMGHACDIGALGPNETVVDEGVAACEPGYCVGQHGQTWSDDNQGICTCRCDGPVGTGPLCACGAGYHCKELIKSFNLGHEHLEGSYCVPR